MLANLDIYGFARAVRLELKLADLALCQFVNTGLEGKKLVAFLPGKLSPRSHLK